MSDNITKQFTYYRQEYSFIFSEPHKELTDDISYILNQITKNKGVLCYLNYEDKHNIDLIKKYKKLNN